MKTSALLDPIPSKGQLTPMNRIRDRLREGYDAEYYAALYRQQNYAFGEPWNQTLPGMQGGEFPDFPAIRVRELEIGRSRRILNSQFVDLARVMYRDPAPKFPQVDKWTAEVRKQFYLTRSRGGAGGAPAWPEELSWAFMHGNGLGCGFIQLGVRTSQETGLQQVTLRHSPTIFTLWDPYEASPGRTNWICFIQHLSVDRAVRRFGPDILDYVDTLTVQGTSGQFLKQVRIFEYYDTGWGDGSPTMAIIPRSLSGEAVMIGRNPFGTLPMAYYAHLVPPGFKRPVGRIALQMATQEGLNKIEGAFIRAIERPSIDYIDPSQTDAKDLERYNEGKARVLKVINPKPGVPPVGRIPGDEVSATTLQFKNHLEEQFNADSGTSDYDRGAMPTGNRTKFEVQEYLSRSAGQGGWADKQAAAYMIRVVDKVCTVAALADRDPVSLDIFGTNVTMNDPSDPRTQISNWMQEPSQILITEDMMRQEDAVAEQAQRSAQLKDLEDLVQIGLVNPVWWAEERLRASGEEDPSVAMGQAGRAMGQSPAMQGGMGMAMAGSQASAMDAAATPGAPPQAGVQDGTPPNP